LNVNIDAANAKSTFASAYANGCPGASLSWYDLSANALVGTLANFAGCNSATGWNGDGTTTISGATGPYRLTYNGTGDVVSVPNSANTIVASDVTMCSWVFPLQNGSDGVEHAIMAMRNGAGTDALYEMFLQSSAGLASVNGSNPAKTGALGFYSALTGVTSQLNSTTAISATRGHMFVRRSPARASHSTRMAQK